MTAQAQEKDFRLTCLLGQAPLGSVEPIQLYMATLPKQVKHQST